MPLIAGKMANASRDLENITYNYLNILVKSQLYRGVIFAIFAFL